MDIILNILLSITSFFIIFTFLVILHIIKTKWIMKNYISVVLTSLLITTISSLFGIILYYSKYNEFNVFFACFGTLSLMFFIGFIYGKNSKNDRLDICTFVVNPGEYEIVASGVDMVIPDIYNVKNYMKITQDGKEKYVIFLNIPPEENKKLVLNCRKDKDNENVFTCVSYYEDGKKSFNDKLYSLFNFYCIILIIYGLFTTNNHYLKYGTDPNNPGAKYIGLVIAYYIFLFTVKSLKKSKEGFSKMIYIISQIVLYIVMIELILILFM